MGSCESLDELIWQRELPRTDALLVDFAEGWMMLGNLAEANEELEKISAGFRCHPKVLAVRWRLYALSQLWEAAWIVSKALCEMLPHQSDVWICQANTLRKYKGVRAAWQLLSWVADRFPCDTVLHYNLACYSCQLGYMEESSRWLLKTFQRATNELKLAALIDPDLKPLWDKIGAGPLITVYREMQERH